MKMNLISWYTMRCTFSLGDKLINCHYIILYTI